MDQRIAIVAAGALVALAVIWHGIEMRPRYQMLSPLRGVVACLDTKTGKVSEFTTEELEDGPLPCGRAETAAANAPSQPTPCIDTGHGIAAFCPSVCADQTHGIPGDCLFIHGPNDVKGK